jgi:hypothetical protein
MRTAQSSHAKHDGDLLRGHGVQLGAETGVEMLNGAAARTTAQLLTRRLKKRALNVF